MSFFMNRWTVSAIALTTLLALNTGVPYITAPQIVLTLSISSAYVSLGLFTVYLMKRAACALLRPLVRTQAPKITRSVSTSDLTDKNTRLPLIISQAPSDSSLSQHHNYNLRETPSRQKRVVTPK